MTEHLDKIYDLTHDIDSNWKESLDKMGLWNTFFDLYAEAGDNKRGNILVAFVVFAYNYKSDMIEFSKDRLDTKRRIMVKFGGVLAMDDKLLHDAAFGLNSAVNRASGKYVEDQRDWRWPDIISKIEIHSRVNALAASNLLPDSDLSKMLKDATIGRKEAQDMWNDIRREYLPLDNALTLEGKPKLTDRMTDFTNWESYIRSIKNEKKRQQDEEEAVREKAKEIIKQQKEKEKEAEKSSKAKPQKV